MSSDFPPQLQLRLPPSTTSFKRSFEEFGFDLASPSGDSDGNGRSSSNGNERNKRPRSASSSRTSDSENSPSEIPHHSASSSSSAASSSTSTSSASAFAHATSPLSSAARPSVPPSHGNSLHLGATSSSSSRPFYDVPTLPTPAIQDIEMLSYLSSPSAHPPTQSLSSSPSSPVASPQSPPPPPPPPPSLFNPNNNNNGGSHGHSHRVQQSEQQQHLRLSLGRFNTFDTTEIAALRRSHSVSSLAPRLNTPPPILPPLVLSDDQPDLAAAALPFLHAGHRSDATLPHPFLDGEPSDSTNRARSRIDVVRPDAISRNTSTDIDVPSFQSDPHLESTLHQQPSHRNDRPSLPLLSPAQASPSTIESSPVNWAQPTPTTAAPTTDPAMEFTAIRDRLDSALEPLRSGSPLVPELAEPGPAPPPPLPLPPVQRQSRTSAPTLPPLRTQLQNASAWDELSPYRMLFFGPSGSAMSAVVQDSNAMQADRPPVDSAARPPVAYWGNAPYPLVPLSVPSPLSTSHRDRESALPSESGHTGNVFPVLPPAQQPPGPHHHHASLFFEELDLGAHPSSLEEAPSSRPQQLSSDSLEGYLSSAEWLPALRRRSAWRLLDSDDEERLSVDARRLRLLAERREAARAGRQEVDSLPELSEPRPPWIDIEDERRPVGSRPPDPPLRSNPFERNYFWEDGDRMAANTAVADDNWSRAESRGDLSQRLERLADLDYDPGRHSLSRSNTTTSAFTAFNRLRSRLYHSTSTRFGSSNSLVTENSSEFRRRSAHQEWMERLSRMNEERAQTQPGSRLPRSSMSSDTSMSDDTRRSGLQPTSTTATAAAAGGGGSGSPFERRLFGSIDGLDEPRQSDPFSFESDHVFEESLPSPRRVSSWPRPPPALSSTWNDHPVRRPVSPPQPPQSHLGRSTSSAQSHGYDPERYSRFLNYLHDYHDSSFYGPPFEFGPPSASHAHPRSSEESTPHRTSSRDSQTDWFSRRRHPPQPHATHVGSWSEMAAEYAQERPSEGGRSSSVFGSRSSARQTDREASFAELRASYDRNSTRANEAQRLSSMSPVSPYLIDVPPLPSPDLSELLENVSHFQQNAPHEERLVSARTVPEMPPRLVPRRRSPTPPPPVPPPAPRLLPRPRVERPPPGRTTSFDHIDPEVFAPGPYRNTFQSLIRRRDASPPASRPPTIPPFPFESGTSLDVPPARRYRHSYAETFDSRPEPAPPPPRTAAESSEELPHPAFWRPRETGRRPALYVRNDWDQSSEDRHRIPPPPPPPPPPPANDLHAFLTRHVRLEGARMDRIAEAAAAQLNEASSNASRFNHAIEVLRGDGLSRRQSADRPLGPRSSGEPPRERTSAEWYHPPVRRRMRARRARPLGDYMRDEDFDESYESLLSLAAAIGEVKPRCTPEDVISKLETATYKDWATTDSDKRCPICLDDYSSSDFVMKAGACSHWLHKDCLHQWLKGANTCPVCRMPVHNSRIRHAPRPRHQRTQVSANSPSTSNNNNTVNISVNVSQDHLAPSPDTTNSQSHNTEASRPFSGRSRNFSGWSGWRYYHP